MWTPDMLLLDQNQADQDRFTIYVVSTGVCLVQL